VSRILIAAAVGLAAVVAALVLYVGGAIWWAVRELPPDSEMGWAIGFDVTAFLKPSWAWLAAGAIFAAAFFVAYRRVR
jgi:hypothetical protein